MHRAREQRFRFYLMRSHFERCASLFHVTRDALANTRSDAPPNGPSRKNTPGTRKEALPPRKSSFSCWIRALVCNPRHLIKGICTKAPNKTNIARAGNSRSWRRSASVRASQMHAKGISFATSVSFQMFAASVGLATLTRGVPQLCLRVLLKIEVAGKHRPASRQLARAAAKTVF